MTPLPDIDVLSDEIVRLDPRTARHLLKACAIALSKQEGPIATAMELYGLADEYAVLCSPLAWKPGDIL